MEKMNCWNKENVNNEALDAFVQELGKRIMEGGAVQQMQIIKKYDDMRFVYNFAKFCGKEEDVEVTYYLHELGEGIGCVTIEGNTLDFTKKRRYRVVLDRADDVEVHTLSNGKLRMKLTFFLDWLEKANVRKEHLIA